MSTTATLYDIANARDILDDWLAESEGELTPELEALLEELDGKAEEKIERVALYIREQLAQAKAIKEEEDRLAARRKARERAAESLKTYLTRQMERLGKDKVQGLLATVAFQNNPPSVVGDLTPEQMERAREVFPEFVRIVPETVSLNRKAVLDYAKTLHADVTLPFGLEVVQTRSLRIR